MCQVALDFYLLISQLLRLFLLLPKSAGHTKLLRMTVLLNKTVLLKLNYST